MKFDAMSGSANHSLGSGSATSSPLDLSPASCAMWFVTSPECQAVDQMHPASDDDQSVTVQCETFICSGTNVKGMSCKRRLGPGTHTRGACCIIHHRKTLLKCLTCSRSYVHEGCFIRVQGALVQVSVAGICQSWQCEVCISGISAIPIVKEESVQATSDTQTGVVSTVEVSGQLSGLSEPVLLFATEDKVRKEARKNGWIARSSNATCIRFCCGVTIEDEKEGEKGKKIKKCSLICIAKRVSDEEDSGWKLKGSFSHKCQPVVTKDVSGFEGFHDKVVTLDRKVYLEIKRLAGSTYHKSHIAHRTSHIAYRSVAQSYNRTSRIAHRTSHIAHRTSHIAHRTSHIAHRTSHIAHRTLHITHRTSHIDRSHIA
jgi:hypothetical protein